MFKTLWKILFVKYELKMLFLNSDIRYFYLEIFKLKNLYLIQFILNFWKRIFNKVLSCMEKFIEKFKVKR